MNNTIVTRGFGQGSLFLTRGFAGARQFRLPAQHRIITRGMGVNQMLVTRGYGDNVRSGGGGPGIPRKHIRYDDFINTKIMRIDRFPEDIRVKASLLSKGPSVAAVFKRVKEKPIRVDLDGDVGYDQYSDDSTD